jgi:predicted nucleic acid-binding protein
VRVVADTNTIVSALLWRGSPHRLVAAIDEYPIAFYIITAADALARITQARASN